MAENISRESVITAITDLMLNNIVGIDQAEKKATSATSEEHERIRQHIRGMEEAFLILMKLADMLELYEEVSRRISIPQRLKQDYLGPEHPNA